MLEDEVKTAVKLLFHHQEAQFYHNSLMEPLEHWQKSVDHKDDYVEKYHIDMKNKVQDSHPFWFYSNMPSQLLIKIMRHYHSAHPCAIALIWKSMSQNPKTSL
jgi:hypothetical protein